MSLELILQLAEKGPQELPQRVLEQLVEATRAAGGELLSEGRPLGSTGYQAGEPHSYALPGTGGLWELRLFSGQPLSPPLQLAAGLALGHWKLREELRQARFAERRRVWEAEGIRAMAEALGGSLERDAVAQALLFHSMALLDARRGEVWLAAELPWDVPLPRGERGFAAVARLGGGVLQPEEVSRIAAGVVEEGRVAAPIPGRGRVLGVLALAEREVRGGVAPFSPQDLETLSLFASQAGLVFEAILAHAQRMEQEKLEQEMCLAASVQRHLLPVLPPRVGGWALAGSFAPTRQVGGDLYDLVPTPRGTLLALFDVAGKGLPAALLAASLQGALRVAAAQAEDLAALARTLDQHLGTLWAANQFATAFLWELGEQGEARSLGAGHTPAILVPATGLPRLLPPENPPLGLVEGARFVAGELTLSPGDTVVLATDGVVEAEDANGTELGLEVLAAVAAENRTSPLEALVAQLAALLEGHSGGAPPHDDRTLLVFRRLG